MPGLDYVKYVTATYQALPDDGLVLADVTSGGFTVTLPSAGASNGNIITVLNYAASNTVTIAAKTGDTIENSNTSLTAQYKSFTYVSDPKNKAWWTIAST